MNSLASARVQISPFDDLEVDEHAEGDDRDGGHGRQDIEAAEMKDLTAFLDVAGDDARVVLVFAVERSDHFARLGVVFAVVLVVLAAKRKQRREAGTAFLLLRQRLAALDPVRSPARRVDRRFEALDKLRAHPFAHLRRQRFGSRQRLCFDVEFFG